MKEIRLQRTVDKETCNKLIEELQQTLDITYQEILKTDTKDELEMWADVLQDVRGKIIPKIQTDNAQLTTYLHKLDMAIKFFLIKVFHEIDNNNINRVIRKSAAILRYYADGLKKITNDSIS